MFCAAPLLRVYVVECDDHTRYGRTFRAVAVLRYFLYGPSANAKSWAANFLLSASMKCMKRSLLRSGFCFGFWKVVERTILFSTVRVKCPFRPAKSMAAEFWS